MLCECGCGLPTNLSPQKLTSRGYIKGKPYRFRVGHSSKGKTPKSGYRTLFLPAHPRASSSGCISEHVLVAENAFGRALPIGSHVHHVDGNGLNNAPSNLVICQDAAYHKLLHIRMAVLRAGGDPNTQRICSTCKQLKYFHDFWKFSLNKNSGIQKRCKECAKAHDYGRIRRGKLA